LRWRRTWRALSTSSITAEDELKSVGTQIKSKIALASPRQTPRHRNPRRQRTWNVECEITRTTRRAVTTGRLDTGEILTRRLDDDARSGKPNFRCDELPMSRHTLARIASYPVRPSASTTAPRALAGPFLARLPHDASARLLALSRVRASGDLVQRRGSCVVAMRAGGRYEFSD